MKQIAALASIASAIVLVSLKIFLTVSTASLGVFSEALHSTLDLVAAVVTFLSVRVADRPADADHPYGHGKFENFSAFVETALLLVAALYIIVEAVERLFFRQVEIRPSLLALIILVVAIGIDLVRSRALAAVTRRYPSDALEADALHFSTDVWSTSAVLAGIAAVWLGQYTGIAWLRYADPLAALAVAAVVIWVGTRLGRRALDSLLDAAPAGLPERVSRAVGELDGVISAERVRVRRSGNRHFVDVTISAPRAASFEQAHAISDAVERRVSEMIPADVMVHMEPRAESGESLFDAIRAAAQRKGLAIHDLCARNVDGTLFIELHLEVDERLSLRQAHDQATLLEEEIRRLPSVHDFGGEGSLGVRIHIEPLGSRIPTGDRSAREMDDLGRDVGDFLNGLRGDFPDLIDCHDVVAQQVEHKTLISCDCAIDGALPVSAVHDLTAMLEDRVKERFPTIWRVTIHPEPPEATAGERAPDPRRKQEQT